jgi:hypothetical protein
MEGDDRARLREQSLTALVVLEVVLLFGVAPIVSNPVAGPARSLGADHRGRSHRGLATTARSRGTARHRHRQSDGQGPGSLSAIRACALCRCLGKFGVSRGTHRRRGCCRPVARAVANVESIVGQIFPATLLARLVTLQLKAREEEPKR